MKFLAIVLAAAMLPFAGFADGNTQLLWPNSGMPDAQAGVAAPYLEWSAAPTANVGSCVIIVAGGDYASTSSVTALRSLEKKLLAKGVTCVWLHNRPSASGLPAYKVAWEDGQRAVRLVRQAASERGYSADKIGVMGFSDGAHLALLLGASSQTAAYSRVDDVDDIACNVNFAIPMSPTSVLTTGTTVDPLFAFDLKTCSMCLFHGQNDAITSPIATTRIYRKLRTTTVTGGAKVPSEIHILPERGHGPVNASEFDRAVEFMCQMGFLGAIPATETMFARFGNDNAELAKVKVSNIWPAGKTPSYVAEQHSGGNNVDPWIEWHHPKVRTTDAILILYAGGAYGFNNTQDFEVVPLQRYLNSQGVTVVNFHYRCPNNDRSQKHLRPWQDLQRAIRLVRAEAPKLGLNPQNIGIMGHSAGGHLTLMGATTSKTAAYAPIDEFDEIPCNAQWAIALFPAYALTDGVDGTNTNGGNQDTDVLVNDFAFDADTCPMMFMHGDKDSYAAMNSVKFWERLSEMGVSSEMHTLANAEHDFFQNSSPGTGSYNYNERVLDYIQRMSSPSLTADYFVSPTGSDDDYGTTRETAFATITHAVDAATDGQRIRLLAGTYEITSSISVAKSLAIVGDTGSADVVVRVTAGSAPAFALNNAGAALSGVTVERGGVSIGANGGTVERCVVRGVEQGIAVDCQSANGLVTHCVITNNGVGVSVSNGGVVRESLMARNTASPVVTIGGTGSLMENCTVAGSSASIPAAFGSTGALVRNTIFYGNAANSFAALASAAAQFVNCATDSALPEGLEMVNAGVTLTADFRPASGSTVIDAGAAMQSPVDEDLSGNVRIANDVVDIGCYEFLRGVQPSGDIGYATDAKTIQDAIDAAVPNGTVELGEGTFFIDAQLNVTGGVRLVGRGWNKTTIRPGAGMKIRCAMLDGGARLGGVTLAGGYENTVNVGGAGAWVKNGTISWCRIVDNNGANHYLHGTGVSFSQGQGTIDHCIVSGNTTVPNVGALGAGIGGEAMTGVVTIDACLVTGNTNGSNGGGGIGFKMAGYNVVVRNCTITGNAAAQEAGGIFAKDGNGKLVLVNNIVTGNTVSSEEKNLKADSKIDSASKNCLFGLAAEANAVTGSISGDAGFVDAASGDYRLANGSSAIGAGATYDGIDSDLDGNPFGATPSIGCYEYAGAEPPAPHVHAWGTPAYSWTATASGYDCTATAVCTGNSSHVTNETVAATYEVATPATETEDGEGVYTATFVNAPFTATKTKSVTIPKSGSGQVDPPPDPGEAISASGDTTGATDATTIQSRIDAAAPSHGTVVLGSGTFYIDAQLMVTGGVTLVGQGWTNTVVKQVKSAGWDEASAKRCAVVKDDAKIQGVTLTGGDSAVDGGGVLVENGVISWCCITNNTVKQNAMKGGGVCFKGGQGSIDHSIVANNKINTASSYGGGIVVTATTGPVLIDTCLVYGNSCSSNCGGGIAIKSVDYDCTVRSCTVANNSAGSSSAGIFRETGSGNLVLVDTIVVSNSISTGEANIQTGWMQYDAANSKNCFFGLEAEAAKVTGSRFGDAGFVDPSNGDYRLQEDSSAKGAGTTYDGIGNDLDGKVFATPPSIGCYEEAGGVVPPAPHSHTWGTPTYSWTATASGYDCTATAVCTEDSSHVTNETVTASYQIVQTATTEAAGTGRYTATFSSALFTAQTKDVVIPVKSAGIEPGATASATRQTIQDAIDAAAPTHGTVTLGEGLFEIDAQLNVTSGVTLVGQGWTNTVIKQVTQVTYGANSRCAMLDGGATIEGVTLTGGMIMNQYDGGGGAWVKDGTISWCCITNNIGGQHSTYGCGVSFSDGQGTIDHCIISGNNATGGANFYGGGIGGVGTVGPVTIDSCLIVNNLLGNCGAGGGIGIKELGGDCIVRNCTIVGNTANTHSAGIRIENRATGNSTAKGVVINTIAVNNMKSGAEVNYADNYVLDKTASKNCFFGLSDETSLAADSLSGDPKFLAASSGDYRLSGESTAKNAGVVYSGIGIDLDGRQFAAAPSIGCYEYDPNALPPPGPTEWDIPGTSGGIKALEDSNGKYVVFTSIVRDGTALTVGFAADKVDANGEVFGLICKTNLTEAATFTINATLTNGATDTLGTLNAILAQPYPQLFAVGIGSAE